MKLVVHMLLSATPRVFLVVLISCGARGSVPDESSGEIEHAPEVCTIEGECTPVDCSAVWTPGPLRDPWWLHDPPADCVRAPEHAEREAYDDCRPDLTGITAEQCGAPRSGAVLCESIGVARGIVTLSCLSERDCPAGMACTVEGHVVDDVPSTHFSGLCTKTCAGTGAASDCVRCDMECDVAEGLCRLRSESVSPPIPCEGDCQCAGKCGQNGYCIDDAMPTRQALCLVGDCACVGGTCDEKRCCHRPDGTIVGRRSDPMCQFPE